ncbi:MAG: hypothetical protein H6509_10480 [Bryobacterales bacterium]|nr:hypothetical protein [Bryobacterales bacterium]
MRFSFAVLAAALALQAPVATAATAESALDGGVSGRIFITRKLTKSRAPAPGAYQRGVAVRPGERDGDFVQAELRRTAIYVESAALPARPVTVEIEQQDRIFRPETVVIPAGSSVSFPNLDPIFHNVFSLSKPQAFDLGNYPRNQTRVVKFSKPGIVPVYCHLHSDMRATVVVAPNSWVAMPGADGRYELPPLPPGEYTVVVWHRTAGFFRKTVQAPREAGETLDFTIPVDPSEQRR